MIHLQAALDMRTGGTLRRFLDGATDGAAQRNDSAAFTAFLAALDAAHPDGKPIHVVIDNASPHTSAHTRAWLDAHRRFVVHRTPPHASWLNEAKVVFAVLERRLLQRVEAVDRPDLQR